jgi:hypothetical protein
MNTRRASLHCRVLTENDARDNLAITNRFSKCKIVGAWNNIVGRMSGNMGGQYEMLTNDIKMPDPRSMDMRILL